MSTPVLVGANYNAWGAGKNGIAGNNFGPVSFGGALYYPLVDFTTTYTIAMFKSTDGGLTWNQVDVAVSNARQMVAAFDATNSRITVAFNNSIGVSNASFDLLDFDLLTEKWGVSYGNSGALVTNGLQHAIYRSDGSLLVFYYWLRSAPTLERVRAAAYSGAWSAEINVSNAAEVVLAAGECAQCSSSFALQVSNDTVHFFYVWLNAAAFPIYFYYQPVHLDNTLGTAFQFNQTDFPTLPLDPNGATTLHVGLPVLDEVNNWLIFPTLTTSTGASFDGFGFLQSDLTGTAWTLTNITPTSILSPLLPGAALYSSGVLRFAMADLEQVLYEYTTSEVTNPSLAAWTESVVLNDPTYFDIVGYRLSDATGFIGNCLFSSDALSGAAIEAFSFLFGGPPPPAGSRKIQYLSWSSNGAEAGGFGPIILPDSNVFCKLNGMKKCVTLGDPQFIRSKAQTMRF